MLIHQFFVFVALLPPISGPLEVSFNYHFGVPSNHNDSTRAFIENHDLVGRKYGVPFRIVKDKDFPEGLTEPRVEDQVDTTLTSKAIDFIRSSGQLIVLNLRALVSHVLSTYVSFLAETKLV